MGHPAIDIEAMPPEDRLELIGELWDSLRRRHESLPVPQSHKDELDARLEAIARGDSKQVDWDAALQKMRR